MGLPTYCKRQRRSPSPELPSECPSKPLRSDGGAYQKNAPAAPDAFATTASFVPPPEPGESPIQGLSDAILLKVLQRFRPTAWDLCRLSCVSRKWRAACSHPSFWTRLRVGTGCLRPGVEQLAPRCTGLKELFVDDPRCELHLLHPIIMACSHSLRRVVIDCDREMSGRNEACISSVLWLVSLYCKNVESIELQSDGMLMTAGCLESRTMWFLTSAFRNLRHFGCVAKGSMTKQCIYLMAIAWRGLECVRLHMAGLTTDDLVALRKCYHLRALELVGGTLEALSVCSVPALVSPSLASHHHHQRHAYIGAPWVHPGVEEDDEADSTTGAQGALAPELVFHSQLELLVLNRVECQPHSVAALAALCPNLKRIVVSGALCEGCLRGGEGPCQLAQPNECIRRQADLIQAALTQIRVCFQY